MEVFRVAAIHLRESPAGKTSARAQKPGAAVDRFPEIRHKIAQSSRYRSVQSNCDSTAVLCDAVKDSLAHGTAAELL